MPIAVAGTGATFPPTPPGPAPINPATGPHRIRLTDLDSRAIAGARVTIDRTTVRHADAGGRIALDPLILRPGNRTLVAEAPGYQAQTLRLAVPSIGRLDLSLPLARVGQQPTGGTPDPGGDGDITLTWGPALGSGDDPLNIAIITPSSDPATLTSDQPGTETDIVISEVFVGAIAAMLTGVPVGTAVSWNIAPADLAGDNQVAWIVAGPCCFAYFRDGGGNHAQGSYSVTATVGGESYGPITLTVGES